MLKMLQKYLIPKRKYNNYTGTASVGVVHGVM
jgi:hypothetical protein